MLLLSLASAVFPMLLYLFLLWKFDKNEPEPIKLVFYHFIYGATFAIVLGVLGSKVLSFSLDKIYGGEVASLLQVIIIAPFVEEISKSLLLFKTIKNKNVDNLTDGLIYGGAIGLGFGMTENFFYFILFGNSLETLLPIFIIRSGFSAVMHSLSTATIGGLMGLTKYSSVKKRRVTIFVSLLIAMFIHFIWNLSVSYPKTFLVGIGFMLVIILLFILVYSLSIKFENKIIKRELSDEIPNELLLALTSTNRNRNNWFLKNYKKLFVKKSILLAFRKHQVEISSNNRELCKKEIKQLRFEISKLIELNNTSKIDNK